MLKLINWFAVMLFVTFIWIVAGIEGTTVISPLNNSHFMLAFDITIALFVYLHEISSELFTGMVKPKVYENKSEYNPSEVVNSSIM